MNTLPTLSEYRTDKYLVVLEFHLENISYVSDRPGPSDLQLSKRNIVSTVRKNVVSIIFGEVLTLWSKFHRTVLKIISNILNRQGK